MADPARARKIADRIQELIAANLQQVVKDPDLGFVTITDVRVTGDLVALTPSSETAHFPGDMRADADQDAHLPGDMRAGGSGETWAGGGAG